MPDWLSKINIFKSQKCAGIHVNILSDSELDISCVILRNKKSILEIEESYYGIKNINELEEFLNPNIPVILSIGGKGIIHKTIQVNNGITGWEQAFPNIKMDEFNSQSFPRKGLRVKLIHFNIWKCLFPPRDTIIHLYCFMNYAFTPNT